MYENELLLVSKLAALNLSSKDATLKKYEYVFGCMQENGLKPTNDIKARLFEYYVLSQSNQQADRILKELSSQYLTKNPIELPFLEIYFNDSVKAD